MSYDLSIRRRIYPRKNPTLTKVIGRRVAAMRELNGLRQIDLAEKVGLSLGGISQIERGINAPSATALVNLTQHLGTTADYLLGLTEDSSI